MCRKRRGISSFSRTSSTIYASDHAWLRINSSTLHWVFINHELLSHHAQNSLVSVEHLQLFAGGTLTGCGRHQPQPANPRPAPDADGLASGFKGSGSCSAVACHGSIDRVEGSAVRRNELTTWKFEDSHSLAYETLLNECSEQIVLKRSGWAGPVLPAYRDARCLACHSTPRREPELEPTSWMNRDGVGCESCHGSAGKWIGLHTTEKWKRLEPERKEQDHGFLATRNLVRRVEVFAGCHVGRRSPDGLLIQDVNHDMIAAGHPRLNFEFAAFQEKLPVHWDENGRNAAPDFPGWPGSSVNSPRPNLPSRSYETAPQSRHHPGPSSQSTVASHAITIWPKKTGAETGRSRSRRSESVRRAGVRGTFP